MKNYENEERMGRFWRAPVIVSLIVSLLLSAPPPCEADQEIVYRLKWLINMSTAGDVYAADRGFFKRQGLRVAVKAGGPERDAIRELELGYAAFGVASADQVIRALSKGAPLVVVAQLFQTNPLQWMYRSDKITVNRPTDLIGKTIGVTYGKNDEIIMRTLLSQAGIGEDQVRLFSVRLDYTPFYKGVVDLWPVYSNTQAIEIGNQMKGAGEATAFLEPGLFGIRFVANSVVASRQLAAENPDLVRRFVKALLAGWREALDPVHADKTLETVRKYDRDASPEVLRQQLAATRRLVSPASGRKIGDIDEDAWRQTEKIMMTFGQIASAVGVERYLRQH